MSSLDAPMQPPSGFETPEQFDEFAREWLERRCFVVKPAEGYVEMTPGELRHLGRLSASGLHKRLHHPLCPAFRAYRGPSGRVVRVLVSPALRAWICAPKKPGCRRVPELPLFA